MTAGQTNDQWFFKYLVHQKLRFPDREKSESNMELSLQHSVQYPSGKPTLVFNPYIVPLLQPNMLDNVDEPWM
jgi:hypothetical protein